MSVIDSDSDNCSICTAGADISDRYLELDSLPCLNVSSSISNIPHLSDLDIDLYVPCDQNFGYYMNFIATMMSVSAYQIIKQYLLYIAI